MRPQSIIPNVNIVYGKLVEDSEDNTLMSLKQYEQGVDAFREWVTTTTENDLVRSFDVLADRIESVVLIRVNCETGETYALGAAAAIEQLIDVSS